MPDPATREEKQRNFDRLLETANRISAEKHAAYVGRELEVLIDGVGRGEGELTGRTRNGRLVHLKGDPARIGQFLNVKISESNTWALSGEIV